MAKKQKHPEHINLERWLISYADFITLLFATFVVLYALSQVDIKDFKALENSIQQAFAAPSVMQGSDGVMQNTSNSLFDSSQADSMVAPLMMEYMSQRYEEQSMQDIEDSVKEAVKDGELEGVETAKTDRGLLIRFNDDYLFASGSATLTPKAKTKLDKVGVMIYKKFIIHNMKIEGHTDNQPIKSVIYPSNWELSSARASSIIRYFISRFNFMPNLFSAVGYAETRPISDNSNSAGRAKNRRIEILILKNKFKAQESATDSILKMSKEEQEKMQNLRLATINRFDSLSEAAKTLAVSSKKAPKKTIILNEVYNKEINRLSKQTQALDQNVQVKITGRGNWFKQKSKINDVNVFGAK